MPKNDTLEIQNFIKELGEYLGFISEIEVRLDKENYYSPIYDVIWFLDLSKKFNIDILKKYISSDIVEKKLKLIPIAAFEIEGAATSSKNQIGNITNLTFGNVLNKFIIVNNEAAIPEKDSYRRGLKITRYFNENLGSSNIIFLDWSQIKDTYNWLNIKEEDREIEINNSYKKTRKGSGGESKSVKIFDNILEDLISSGLEIKQDYTPDKCKMKYYLEDYISKKIEIIDEEIEFYFKRKAYKDPNEKNIFELNRINNRYYLPKLDIVLGFNIQKSFIKWIKGVSKNMGNDILNNELIFSINTNKIKDIFIPLLSIEIENEINKHLNGAIINMWKNSYLGILISKKQAVGHLEYFKNNGCNNIYFWDSEIIKN